MSALLQQMRQDAPVALWPMQEPSGTTLVDIISGNNLTLAGGPARAAAPWGQAISFDGVDDIATRAATAALELQTFTVVMCVRIMRAPGANEWLYNYDSTDSDSVGKGFVTFLAGSGGARIQKGSGDGTWEPGSTTANTATNNGAWHVYAGSYQNAGGANALRTILDGGAPAVSAAIDTHGISYSNPSGPSIGGYLGGSTPTQFSKVDIAYCGVYNTVLSTDRIAAITRAALRSGVSY